MSPDFGEFMAYGLGIDLGTTFSAAAVARRGRPEIVELGDHGYAVPSVVYVGETGNVVVGDAADRSGLTAPGRVAREFKRRFGDPTPLVLGGTPFGSDALTAMLLRWIVDSVDEREGGPPDVAVLAHPASWGQFKIDLLRLAVHESGVGEAAFITEPEAAVLHYASLERNVDRATIAVYDLGGGTFDATVVAKRDDDIHVLGEPEGLERLGGIDFDEAVFQHVLAAIDLARGLGDDEELAGRATALLRAECVRAKEALSSDTEVEIPVFLPKLQTEVRLTRGEFERMIRPAIERTLNTMGRVIDSASLQHDDIDAILLVGGSSRIPLIAEMVASRFGRPVAIDSHPKHAVALGAAALALELMSETVDDVPAPVDRSQGDDVTGGAPPVEPSDDEVQDSSLDVVDQPAGEPALRDDHEEEATGRGRTRIIAGATAILLVAAVVVFAVTRGGDDTAGTGGGTTTEPVVTTSPGPTEQPEETASPTSAPPATPTAGPLPIPAAAGPAPASTVLVSERPTDGARLLRIVGLDGQTGEPGSVVVSSEEHNLLPVWSPDRRSIAFSRTSPDFSTWSLWLAEADGSNETLLEPELAGDARASWSADGRFLLYIVRRGDADVLVVRDLATDVVTTVLDQAGTIGDPVFSPSGDQVMFWRETVEGSREEGSDLVLRDLVGGEERVFSFPGGGEADPSWHPDGDRVVLARTDGDWDLYLLDVVSGEFTQVTDTPEDDQDPAWGPDGSILFGRSRADGGRDIWRVDPAAPEASPTQLTDDAALQAHPAWTTR